MRCRYEEIGYSTLINFVMVLYLKKMIWLTSHQNVRMRRNDGMPSPSYLPPPVLVPATIQLYKLFRNRSTRTCRLEW
eukprot:SAG31_NODE_62_length_28678_cov_21.548270_28_plen_77_part_00